MNPYRLHSLLRTSLVAALAAIVGALLISGCPGSLGADDHGDFISGQSATRLTLAGDPPTAVVQGVISSANDFDSFVFSAQADARYTTHVEASFTDRLYFQVLFEHEHLCGSPDYEFTAPADGEMYVRMTTYRYLEESTYETGPYTLTITQTDADTGGDGAVAEVTQTIDVTGGRVTLTTEDGEAAVDLPANAAEGGPSFSTEVTMAAKPAASPPPDGFKAVGQYVYDLSATQSTFARDVTVTLPIPGGAAASGEYVIMWRDAGEWVPLLSRVAADRRSVSAPINHFTEFGVFYAEQVPALCAAAPAGILVGTAVQADLLDSSAAYRAAVAHHFNFVTTENEMKWGNIHPNENLDPNDASWDAADRIVDFAERSGLAVKGHTLIWHAQNPAAVRVVAGAGLETLLEDHIEKVVGRYGARVLYWDVVNEAFTDNGTLRNASAIPEGLGPVWGSAYGGSVDAPTDEYIIRAFKAAYSANPCAILIYNDYDIETWQHPKKVQAVRDLFENRLFNAGIPKANLGLGFQCHFKLELKNNEYVLWPNVDDVAATLDWFALLGVHLFISELDLRRDEETAALCDSAFYAAQHAAYRDLLRAVKDVPNLRAVTTWGFVDGHSWYADCEPLLFKQEPPNQNIGYVTKPAFYGYRDGLAALKDTGTVADPTCTGEVDSDGDGVPDDQDGCPNDRHKTAPGNCGCGQAEVAGCGQPIDSDGDGTPDSQDACPNDRHKTAPGNCGCGQPETSGCGGAVVPGSIVAWGRNNDGQCNVPSPNEGFVAVAGGGAHSLGLKSDGSIVAWGSNGDGQCDVPSPNEGFVAVAGGKEHSLGLKSDGSIVAWGWNVYGQCIVPAPNSGFVAIAAGYGHSLGLKDDGSIVAWGDYHFGQRDIPSPNGGFVAVVAGDNHSLGLKADGSIVAWGDDRWGQCHVPVPNNGFVGMAAGGYHSLGLKADGSVVALHPTSAGIPVPNSGFVAIAGGCVHSLGLKADGSIVAAGDNDYGQCSVPVPNIDFVAVAAGRSHSLGLKSE